MAITRKLKALKRACERDNLDFKTVQEYLRTSVGVFNTTIISGYFMTKVDGHLIQVSAVSHGDITASARNKKLKQTEASFAAWTGFVYPELITYQNKEATNV